MVRSRESRTIQIRPPNVPQQYANQALHARYAAHACTFFLSDFVSIENKGSKIQIPKLVIRVRFPSPAPVSLVILRLKFHKLEKLQKDVR